MNDLYSENADSETVDVETTLVRKCRLTRNNSVQYQKICAKEERNASIKKVVLLCLCFVCYLFVFVITGVYNSFESGK